MMLAGATAIFLSGCGKSPAPEGAAAEGAAPEAAVEAVKTGLSGSAERLGFAAHCPKNAAFFLGAVDFQGHTQRFEASAVGQRLMDFTGDKLPTSKKKKEAEWKDFEGIFLSLGAGGEKFGAWIREVSDLYNEVTYRTLFAGGLTTALGGKPEPTDFLVSALADDKLMDRGMKLLETLEFPPLLLGVKSPKAEKWLEEAMKEDGMPELLKEAPRSQMETPLGGKMEVFELDFSKIITQEMVEKAKKNATSPQHEQRLTQASEILRKKKGKFAMGVLDGHLVVALGANLDHVAALVTDPAQSMLAKTDWDSMAGEAGSKNVLAVISAEATLLESMTSPTPFVPIVKGLMAGLEQSEIFAPVAEKLEPMVADLEAKEKVVFMHDWQDMALLAWWEDGLHLRAQGGAVPQGVDWEKPTALAPLLADPDLLLGMVGRDSSSGAGRAYFEQWMVVIYEVVGELAGMGVMGEQGPMMLAMAQQAIVPGLVSVYEGSREIYQNGLGSDSALVIDVGGKMPTLPGVPPMPDEAKMLRISTVRTVKDRAAVAAGWQKMESELANLLKALPAPQPLSLPSTMSSEKAGLTTYFYPIPFMSDDLLPCSSISDQYFFVGTSKALNEKLDGMLKEGNGTAPTGMMGRVNFPVLRDLLIQWSKLSQKADAEEKEQAIREMMEPLGVLDYRAEMERGKIMSRMDWPMKDVKRVD
ncbi:MAG: hypothetical protein KDK99_13575 [Verrucomicrobiales bacterium]|nr:hypothetical protein [Verrucomicrobiales bacterium]